MGYFLLPRGRTRVDDVIAMPRCGKLPLVVRRHERAKSSSDADVHDLMHGEGFHENLCPIMGFVQTTRKNLTLATERREGLARNQDKEHQSLRRGGSKSGF